MTSGRPRSTSRDALAEAACELFLERGYAATSVADIAQRAGVGRSSFFNYFDAKAAIVWNGFDQAVSQAEALLATSDDDAADDVRRALSSLASAVVPDALTLVFAHRDAMEYGDELDQEAAVRSARIGRAVASRLRRNDAPNVIASVVGAAHGAAVLVAVEAWSRDASRAQTLSDAIRDALATVDVLLRGAVAR